MRRRDLCPQACLDAKNRLDGVETDPHGVHESPNKADYRLWSVKGAIKTSQRHLLNRIGIQNRMSMRSSFCCCCFRGCFLTGL